MITISVLQKYDTTRMNEKILLDDQATSHCLSYGSSDKVKLQPKIDVKNKKMGNNQVKPTMKITLSGVRQLRYFAGMRTEQNRSIVMNRTV